ncbi:MAG: winged helix-turn-helix domain-containing protein, partial [Chloroflexota bacterium]|nr:winged helix-turn-helix domain-containing protein [Chloroflexota bacterium]
MSSKVTYRQQYTRCGKERCRKCRKGSGHGPYWYAYWSENGRTISKYIGIHLPPHVETQQAITSSPAMQRVALPSGTVEAEVRQGLPGPSNQQVLRIYVLGQFRIDRLEGNEWHEVSNRTWHRRRPRALLGCLLSSPGRRLGREQIMDALWPDLDIETAANRLNGAVHELRQILEPGLARPAASHLLRLERNILGLADRNQVWVDAEAFENVLNEANTTPDPLQIERLLEQAEALYGGTYLLEELYSEWAAPRREALKRSWTGLLLKLAELREARGALVNAMEPLNSLLAADPTNETAVQRLMLLLTRLDRRGEALATYRRLATRLERNYESEPLPETCELFELLKKGIHKLPGQSAHSSLSERPPEKNQFSEVSTLPVAILPKQDQFSIPADTTGTLDKRALSAVLPPISTRPNQFGRSNQ